ncbi:MBL fold metallo-hydrolase [Pareuzebyella sediminis]|uniref:MBL fold metallo-hydrolase n=1 Tax=Pareuzebyella sediminis TaxID=2607998 RepID=UPI0011EDA649|nr:MBL fold metallo-hydrolase [Pareuzebyella sediminis]
MFISIIGLVVIVAVAYILFVNFYPSFGGDISKERQDELSESINYKDGQFVNKKDVPEELSFMETLKLARHFFFTEVPDGRPKENIEVHKIDSINVAQYLGHSRLIWFGHSAFLLQLAGKNLLIDPMFGQVAAPHDWLGSDRFNEDMPIPIEQLPKIDAVLISHDHYDHLDYGSIKKLKDKVDRFYVPLGVGVHLEAWGIESERIKELDWWQDTSLDGLTFVCTPAQHFSGRKFNNRQSTLWASWVIISETERIFFSGDSGYAPHFEEIGTKYGPFDLAMMECGQYNERWADIHMMPEETAQAGIDVRAKALMPIHWGAFKLALHSWTDPIQRVMKKGKTLDITIVTPRIGQPVVLKDTLDVYDNWWNEEK